jgi:hypothetical protein
MPSAVQVALTAGPLAFYFLVLGIWRWGRSPRVIHGPIDFGLLAFGVGGLVAFGPIGDWLVHRLFPAPSPWAWMAVATFLWLLALLWAPRTARRLVIYNVDPATLREAIRELLDQFPGPYVATLHGFEDSLSGRGLTIEVPSWSRTATVEAIGRRPEELIAVLAPALRERLRGTAPRDRVAATAWLLLSGLTVALPIFVMMFNRPQVRAALRALLERLRGG